MLGLFKSNVAIPVLLDFQRCFGTLAPREKMEVDEISFQANLLSSPVFCYFDGAYHSYLRHLFIHKMKDLRGVYDVRILRGTCGMVLVSRYSHTFKGSYKVLKVLLLLLCFAFAAAKAVGANFLSSCSFFR